MVKVINLKISSSRMLKIKNNGLWIMIESSHLKNRQAASKTIIIKHNSRSENKTLSEFNNDLVVFDLTDSQAPSKISHYKEYQHAGILRQFCLMIHGIKMVKVLQQ